MRDTMRHRGPDAAGHWQSPNGNVFLGHRRLSIIDLSPTGAQPLTDATGEWHITFNGEIYNYRELRAELETRHGAVFRTPGDTEVLLVALRQWGLEEGLRRIHGMFAFGLWHEPSGCLWLGRDRAGEKPLFYGQADGHFLFASELKALLLHPAVPRRVDPQGLAEYLGFGFVHAPRTLLAGLWQLPPASWLEFRPQPGTLRTGTYWTPPPPPATPVHETVLLAELEQHLETATRRQLLAADVPVGVLLSGGIDSGLVACLAARATPQPLHTFTIAFPGHGSLDESQRARALADYLGTRHTELSAPVASVDLLPEVARQCDNPVADPSLLPSLVLARLVRQVCTVALGGDGGDELWGGYDHHRHVLAYRPKPKWLRPLVQRLPIGLAGRNAYLQQAGDATHYLSHARLFQPDEVSWLTGLPPATIAAAFAAHTPARPLEDVAQTATRLDFSRYLPGDALAKVDRMSMLASLEVRAPMLDAGLLDFAHGRVPARLKATAVEQKILPKRLARKLFPPYQAHALKQGFAPPMAAWLRGPARHGFAEHLHAARGLVRPGPVERLWQWQQLGASNSTRLFGLALLQLWAAEYGVTL